jgi:3-keto-L-gulonate-6-phosphate decarboxylase
MATDKMFTVFGVSKQNGEYKVRFATDLMRVKVLAKHGHEDIRLVEVGTAVTKYEGIKQIQGMSEFADAAAQSAILEYLEDKAPKAKTAPKAKATAVKAPAKAKAVKASKVDTAAMEDAPF